MIKQKFYPPTASVVKRLTLDMSCLYLLLGGKYLWPGSNTCAGQHVKHCSALCLL